MELAKRQKRILVLDNGGRMLPVIEEIMAYGDFDMHVMYDPNYITYRAKELKPDLIILDYLLVNNDCALVCQDLKEEKGLEQIPVIVVARYMTKKIRSESYKCDALFVNTMDMGVIAPRINYLIAS
jgi:PleD family two-component response regulator